MQSIALDSGPAFALFHVADPHHRRTVDRLKGLPRRSLVTSVPVITEVCYFLGRRKHQFLDWIGATVLIDDEFEHDLARIRRIIRDYRDHEIDLADASLLALCERRRIRKIATIDVRHFSILRTRDGRSLELILGTE